MRRIIASRLARAVWTNLLGLVALVAVMVGLDPYGLAQAGSGTTSPTGSGAQPVPEPSTIALFISAIALLAFVIALRRQRRAG